MKADRCWAGWVTERVGAGVQQMVWNDDPRRVVPANPVTTSKQLIDPASHPARLAPRNSPTSSRSRGRRTRPTALLTLPPALLLLGGGIKVLEALVYRHQAATNGHRRLSGLRRPHTCFPPALGVRQRRGSDWVAAAEVQVARWWRMRWRQRRSYRYVVVTAER